MELGKGRPFRCAPNSLALKQRCSLQSLPLRIRTPIYIRELSRKNRSDPFTRRYNFFGRVLAQSLECPGCPELIKRSLLGGGSGKGYSVRCDSNSD